MSHDGATEKIINGEEKVVFDNEVKIAFDYPLNGTFIFNFKSEDGFTRKQLADIIIEQYRKMYAEEEKTRRTPQVVSRNITRRPYPTGFASRNPTDGKYGIGNYNLTDLGLNAMFLSDKDHIWRLSICS